MSINALGVANSNSLHQVTSGNSVKTSGSKSPTTSHATSSGDTTSFISDKQTVQSLSQAAVQASPSRQATVDALRQSVSSGQYKLDSSKIAESLVNADI